MVDQQHPGPVVVADRADDLCKLGHLGLRQAGGGLVHEHECRLGDERARHPQPALVALGKGAGVCVGQIRQAQALEQLACPPPRLARSHANSEGGHLDVLADGQSSKRAAVLERAGQP